MIFHDISQVLCEETAVWPGDDAISRRWTMRLCNGESSNVSAFSMSVHAGTHVDAPFHVDDSGIDVGCIPIRHFIGPVRVFSVVGKECMDASDLSILDWRGVERVLFKTGAGGRGNFEFSQNYTCLDRSAAEFLVNKKILLVGIDAPSVDAFDSHDLQVHKILLRNETFILENACLDNVLPGDYELACLPLKLAGMDASPVRAVLWRA